MSNRIALCYDEVCKKIDFKTFANISLLNHKIGIIFKKTIFDIEGMTLITHSYAPFYYSVLGKSCPIPLFAKVCTVFSVVSL